MFLTGALIMVWNIVQTVRSPTTELDMAAPLALAAAGE
jgi:cbb3-type cytochrome oxidase subunit 1